ncbi:MAG: AMP-binding protein [Firmicutes bacterium]|nr:AMP-binding protein [Bacillota bacterium]
MYQYKDFFRGTVEEIEQRQNGRIREMVEYAYHNSFFYREMMDIAEVKPQDVQTAGDLKKLPITRKDDLREYNDRFFAAPRSRWLDIASTSGSTGAPVYIPFTLKDMERISLYGAQTLSLSGLSGEDTVHLTLPMSAWLWMAGFGFYFCFTTLGTGVTRFGPGFSEKSIRIIQETSSTALMAAPSFALKLGREIKRKGISHSIKRIFIVGENVLDRDLKKNGLGRMIEEAWNAELFSCYGATEGCFVTVECSAHNGHHINPDEVFFEILDPDTLEPVEDGKEGLVAITPLGVEGMPLLRYMNGDRSYLIPGPCPCGNMHKRLGPILARNDHMVKIKGVMVYPDAVKNVLSENGIVMMQVEVVEKDFANHLIVYIPAKPGDNTAFEAFIQEQIRRKLGVTLEVRAIEEDELNHRIMPEATRKPVVFVDNRPKNNDRN